MKGVGLNRALAAAAFLAASAARMPGAAVQLMAQPLETFRATPFPMAPGVRRPPPYPRKRAGNSRRLQRAHPMKAAGRRRRAFLRKARR